MESVIKNLIKRLEDKILIKRIAVFIEIFDYWLLFYFIKVVILKMIQLFLNYLYPFAYLVIPLLKISGSGRWDEE